MGQEEIGEVPSVFGTLSMAFLCEKFPSQLEEKPGDKTSDNFSTENFVLVKSADPIMDTFQNPSQFCHISQEEKAGAITALPWSLGTENSSLRATQSLTRSHQRHFLNTKNFVEARKTQTKRSSSPWGMFPGHPSHLHPSLNGACLEILTPLTPGWRRGRRDGWEALSLHREEGLDLGEEFPGWGAAAGRGKVSYCSVRPHCPSHTHTRGGMQVGGGSLSRSPGPCLGSLSPPGRAG